MVVGRDLRGIAAHDVDADPLKVGKPQRHIPLHGGGGLPLDAEQEIGLVKVPADEGRILLGNSLFQHIFPEIPVKGLQAQL